MLPGEVKNLPARQETWVQSLDWDDPTPIFLPGEFYGQRNLAGYSPWGHKESDASEQRTFFPLCIFRNL